MGFFMMGKSWLHLPLADNPDCSLLLICGSYSLFTSTLMRMRRRAMLSYGAFARAGG